MNSLSRYIGPIATSAQTYRRRFTKLGMSLTPDRILSVAMLESGGTKDPAKAVAKNGGLGVMQLKPHKGKFDQDVAREIGWDNNSTVPQNRKNSDWANPMNNINAGVLTWADKAAMIARKFPNRWAQMSEDQKWDATFHAYNHGQANTFKLMKADTGRSYHNISGDTYVKKVNAFSDHLDSYSPFPQASATPTSSYEPDCKIEVRAKPIPWAPESMGYYHLFIVFTDQKGIPWYFRGGPERPIPGLWGPIAIQWGKYFPSTVDWYPGGPSVTIQDCPDPCSKYQLLIRELSRIGRTNTPYQLLGPNSNSVAYTLLVNCGIPPQMPNVDAPGWGQLIG